MLFEPLSRILAAFEEFTDASLVSGAKPWIWNSPFSIAQIEAYNRYSHFPIDPNKEFDRRTHEFEMRILDTFTKRGLAYSDSVLKALVAYRQAVYEYYLAETRAREQAPPMQVVGPARYGNYEKRREKAERMLAHASKHIQLIERRTQRLVKSALMPKNDQSPADTTSIQASLEARIETALKTTKEAKQAMGALQLQSIAPDDTRMAVLATQLAEYKQILRDLVLDQEATRQNRPLGMKYVYITHRPIGIAGVPPKTVVEAISKAAGADPNTVKFELFDNDDQQFRWGIRTSLPLSDADMDRFEFRDAFRGSRIRDSTFPLEAYTSKELELLQLYLDDEYYNLRKNPSISPRHRGALLAKIQDVENEIERVFISGENDDLHITIKENSPGNIVAIVIDKRLDRDDRITVASRQDGYLLLKQRLGESLYWQRLDVPTESLTNEELEKQYKFLRGAESTPQIKVRLEEIEPRYLDKMMGREGKMALIEKMDATLMTNEKLEEALAEVKRESQHMAIKYPVDSPKWKAAADILNAKQTEITKEMAERKVILATTPLSFNAFTFDELMRAINLMQLQNVITYDAASGVGKHLLVTFLQNRNITPDQVAATLGVPGVPNRLALDPTTLPTKYAEAKRIIKTKYYIGTRKPSDSILLLAGANVNKESDSILGEYVPRGVDLFVIDPSETKPENAIMGLDILSSMPSGIAYLVNEVPIRVLDNRKRKKRRALLEKLESEIKSLKTVIQYRQEGNDRLIEGALGPAEVAGMRGELAALEAYKAAIDRGEEVAPPDMEKARNEAATLVPYEELQAFRIASEKASREREAKK